MYSKPASWIPCKNMTQPPLAPKRDKRGLKIPPVGRYMDSILCPTESASPSACLQQSANARVLDYQSHHLSRSDARLSVDHISRPDARLLVRHMLRPDARLSVHHMLSPDACGGIQFVELCEPKANCVGVPPYTVAWRGGSRYTEGR